MANKKIAQHVRIAIHNALRDAAKTVNQGDETRIGVLVCDGSEVRGCVPNPAVNVLLIMYALVSLGYTKPIARQMAEQAFNNSPGKARFDMEAQRRKMEEGHDSGDPIPVPVQ